MIRGRRVLLKPNLVEPSRARPHMTTHPSVVLAAVEVFQRLGGHGRGRRSAGHVRDSRMALMNRGSDRPWISSGSSSPI